MNTRVIKYIVVTAVLTLGGAASAFAFNDPPAGSPPNGNGSVVTSAANNVGVGAANPGSRLTVRNSSAGTVFAVRNTGDTANTFTVSDTGAITAGSMAWSLLTNFPAGCSAGYAVQTIGVSSICVAVGAGTVTSVSGSGGTTGLTLNGGPITTSGTLTIGGTLVVANGGTGASNALTARANLGAAASGANNDITSLTGLTTALSATQGGTAQTTYATGDIVYASGVNTLAKRTIGAAGTVLTVSGGVPVWTSPASGITSLNAQVGSSQTFANDTNVTLTSSVNTHSLGWSGTLSVARGGTGAATAATARTNLGAAASGANSDITSLTGLTTALSATQGGTAQTTYATGDILFASGVSTLARRAIGSVGQVLTVSGGAPAWATPANGTVTSVSGSGGTSGLTLTGGPITTSGTLTIGGTLAAVNGGTAQTTYATGDILYASGVNALTKRNIGSPGQVLTVSGGVPTWATPASGVGGSGTTNKVPKFTAASTVGDSQIFDNGSTIGIGTVAPTAGDQVEVANASGARVTLSDGGGAARYYLLLQSPTAAQTYARVQSYRAAVGAQNLVLQDSGGNVGIGTVNPAQKLDVSGTAQVTGFKLTTGAVNGYVLKSDAAGVGTWQAAAAGTVTSVSGSGGTTGLTLTGGPITTSGTLTIGGTLAVANGGTGATTASGARTNLGAAASGVNGDITSLSGLTTDLSVAQGGTGLSSPGASGNVLTSNGVAWVSQAETGDISGVTAGTGLTGGGTTGSATLNLSTPVTAANGGTGITSPGASGNVLTSNGAAWVSQAPASSGEANTASNVGVGGVGVFKQKTGVNLEFKNINAGSSKLTVTNDAVNNEVDVDVVESALTHDNIGGTLGVAKGGTGGITAAAARTNLGAAASGANGDITQLSALITPLTVGQGGTDSTTAFGARLNLGAAASGANSDITSLSGLTTSLSVAQGGTGAVTLPLNNVLLGNDAAAVQSVAPGTSGNILTSNGTTWVSQAPSSLTGNFGGMYAYKCSNSSTCASGCALVAGNPLNGGAAGCPALFSTAAMCIPDSDGTGTTDGHYIGFCYK